MIFAPYFDEQQVIKMIHKYNSKDFALLRVTQTMVNKNNTDANGIFRDLLKNNHVVDFSNLDPGGVNGVNVPMLFAINNIIEESSMKFYLVSNSRGDRRFSIKTLKQKCKDKKVNVGDLLYFTIIGDIDSGFKIVMLNLTHNIPEASVLEEIFGVDQISVIFMELYKKVKAISQQGYHKNSAGKGSVKPKDVGDTLERLLGISQNNSPEADYKGIEIKAKSGRTLDTLFTLRPCFEGTSIADYEPSDRSRVSAFARYYGYDSQKHPDSKSLYITIGSKDSPQNKQGFYLELDEEARKVNLHGLNPITKKDEITAFWTFDDLKESLMKKHPATLWVKATHRMNGEVAEFKYTSIELSREPQFLTFLNLIKSGAITYDWRGYTSVSGKYVGKNHGNAWRLKPQFRPMLFGDIEQYSLD